MSMVAHSTVSLIKIGQYVDCDLKEGDQLITLCLKENKISSASGQKLLVGKLADYKPSERSVRLRLCMQLY